MRLQDLKEIEDGYYTVCVEIDHRCFNDSVEIHFSKIFPLRFVESKSDRDYSLKDKCDYFGRTIYVGCIKNSSEINLYFQITHKINLNGVNKKEIYYLLCKECYVQGISTIIKDINQSC